MYKLNRAARDFDIINVSEGNDIYNSQFLLDMDSLTEVYRYPYHYNKGRVDLIAKDIYHSDGYVGVIPIFNRVLIDEETPMYGMRALSQLQVDSILK